MGRDGPCYISKQVNAEIAALGFRVKSGWAAVVLLTGPIGSPALRDNRVIDLSDPRFSETRQPYHAAMGQLEMDTTEINRRTDIVQRITKQFGHRTSRTLSAERLLDHARLSGGWKPARPCNNCESAHSRACARRSVILLSARRRFARTRHSHRYSPRARCLCQSRRAIKKIEH